MPLNTMVSARQCISGKNFNDLNHCFTFRRRLLCGWGTLNMNCFTILSPSITSDKVKLYYFFTWFNLSTKDVTLNISLRTESVYWDIHFVDGALLATEVRIKQNKALPPARTHTTSFLQYQCWQVIQQKCCPVYSM